MDKIQKMFQELKTLHAELHESNEKAEEYIKYLEEMNAKAQRLQELNDALHIVMGIPQREENAHFEECIYWSATKEQGQPIWTVTDHSYTYYEEDTEEMEKLYLQEKLENDLGDSSTKTKRTKI
ncbi:hypothetical protein [Burkholderia cenocepacia]|uniref:hypothetical protein n=1 Tax=Burkholderia cenocepacia TaxID=95486 RepID=UPI0011157420|nr:hypothetical protein [Burkholderia cenocepacia]